MDYSVLLFQRHNWKFRNQEQICLKNKVLIFLGTPMIHNERNVYQYKAIL